MQAAGANCLDENNIRMKLRTVSCVINESKGNMLLECLKIKNPDSVS
jgi:hypothetical protein